MCQPGTLQGGRLHYWSLFFIPHLMPFALNFPALSINGRGKKTCPSYCEFKGDQRLTLQMWIQPTDWSQTQLSPSYNSGEGINYSFKTLNFSAACSCNTTVETVVQCIYDLKKLHNSGVGIIVPILHSVVQLLSHIQHDPKDCYSMPGFPVLSFTISQSLLKLMSTESVMPSNHLILCCPLLLPSIFPSIRVFSSEPALHTMWPKYWSFSFSISPSSEYSGFIFFTIDCFDLLAVQRTLKSILQHHSSKASVLQ